MRTYLIFIIILLLLSNCKQIDHNEKDHGVQTINIDFKNRKATVSITKHIDSIDIIPLEKTENSMLNKKITDKNIFYKNIYYILDKKQKSIKVFDNQGNFKFRIRDFGRGPNEYRALSDFCINEYTNNIELLTSYGKLFIYDLKGNFIKKINLSSIRGEGSFINYSKEKIIFYFPFKKQRLVVYSRNKNKPINTLHNIPKFISRKTPISHDLSPFFEVNEMHCFFEPFSNKVYKIKENQIYTRYKFDFGKYNFTMNDIPQDKTIEYYGKYFKDLNKIHMFFNHIENTEYLIRVFKYKKDDFTLIYNKNNKNHVIFEDYLCDNKRLAFPTYLNLFDHGIYNIVNPLYLKNFICPQLLDRKDKMILDQIESSDNHFIIKYYFKKNIISN